jgi:hypothetical protein
MNPDGTPTRGDILTYVIVAVAVSLGSSLLVTVKLDAYSAALDQCYAPAAPALFAATSWQSIVLYVSLSCGWVCTIVFLARLFAERRTVWTSADQHMFQFESTEYPHRKHIRYLLRRSAESKWFAAVAVLTVLGWVLLFASSIWLAVAMKNCDQCIDLIGLRVYCGFNDAGLTCVGVTSTVVTYDARLKLFRKHY